MLEVALSFSRASSWIAGQVFSIDVLSIDGCLSLRGYGGKVDLYMK